MKATHYEIAGPWPGKLAMIPRPRGGDWLEADVCSLQEAGFGNIVSLLTDEELAEMELTAEKPVIEQAGGQCFRFPIPDLGIPASRRAASELLLQLSEKLELGQHVAIHCRQSIGRAGMIASSLLVMAGIDPTDAMERASLARGITVPETEQQRQWVIGYRSWSKGESRS